MQRADVLDAAKKAVCGQRHTDYGKAEDNFARIARRWNCHLDNIGFVVTRQGVPCRLLPHDVASMMIDVKLSRIENTPSHDDSWVDIAGYAACGSEVAPVTDDAFHASIPASQQYRDEDRAAQHIPDVLTDWPPTLPAQEQKRQSCWGFTLGQVVKVNDKSAWRGRCGVVRGFTVDCVMVEHDSHADILYWAPHFLSAV